MEISSSYGGPSVDRSRPVQQLFSKIDADGDGKVSQSEFSALEPPQTPAVGGFGSGAQALSSNTLQSLLAVQETDAEDHWASLDTDGDGALSEAELAAGAPPPPGGPGRMRGEEDEDGLQQLLEALDSDGDGTIDETELAALQTPPAKEKEEDATTRMFQSLDTNGDGAIDAEELAALRPPERTEEERSEQSSGSQRQSRLAGLLQSWSTAA